MCTWLHAYVFATDAELSLHMLCALQLAYFYCVPDNAD